VKVPITIILAALAPPPRPRLRCCGRWCYWRVPIGPWACSSCERPFPGGMPDNALARFWSVYQPTLPPAELLTPGQQRVVELAAARGLPIP